MSAQHTGPLIIATPEAIAEVMAPYFDLLAEKALERATARATDEGRMINYEAARKMLGLGKTRFSQAVTDGSITYYPNGLRGKLFKVSDLRNFSGYQPKTEAEKQFEAELANRK